MRLDKFLSHTGYGSRKEVKQLLKKGAISVNSETVKDAKTQLNMDHDVIFVFGEQVHYQETIYLMLNKPKGVITATEDNFQKTVIDLLEIEDQLLNPFPVGRLDKDTEGLLIITNDGKLSHRLLSPKHHVPKTYIADIEGRVTDKDIALFAEGVILEDGYKTKPAKLVVNVSGNISSITLTITEGKFHQVKRMFQAVDKMVLTLKRIQMGSLVLDDQLAPGTYRPLTDDELALLEQE